MVMLDYDGNVVAMVGGLGEKTSDLTLNRAYSVTRQTGSAIKPIGAYALGIEYGLVNWSTMLNNSPLYNKADMIIRDDDYCRRNGLSGLSDEALRAYPNAWRSWPKNYGGNYGDNQDVPLWNGLARSLNTIAVRIVADLVTPEESFRFMEERFHFDLEEGREMAEMSYRLATIVTDAPLDFAPEENLRRPAKPELYGVFLRLEFTKLIEKMGLTGEGTVTLTIQGGGQNKSWVFTGLDGSIICDSEQMNFYSGMTPMNDKVSGNGFPRLQPGVNTISWVGTVTSLVVQPRWVTL